MSANLKLSDEMQRPSEYWDVVADDYPQLLSLLYRAKKSYDRDLLERWLDLLPQDRSWSLLDAGCGKGEDVVYFAHRGFDQLTGVDHSRRMLASALKRIRQYHGPADCTKLRFLEMDLQELDFADAQFSTTCSFSVIDHIPTLAGQNAAIDHLVRVTERGGLLVLTFPNTDALASRLKKHRDLTVAPLRVGDMDVVVVRDRRLLKREVEYEYETTYSDRDLERVYQTRDDSLELLEFSSGVMTDVIVVGSLDDVPDADALPPGCEVLVDLTERASSRRAVIQTVDWWSALPVEGRGLRIGLVARRR